VNGSTVSVLEGNTFVVSGRNGDVDGSPSEPHGLFHRDTRFLSRLVLTVDGKTLQPLSTDDVEYFEAQFFLVPGTGSAYTDATLSVQRRRVVGEDGFSEELIVMNHAAEPARIEIRLELDADFADLFEVKDAKIATSGSLSRNVDAGRLVLRYERDAYVRETWVRPRGLGHRLDEAGVTFPVDIIGHGSWTGGIEVVAAAAGVGRYSAQPPPRAQPTPD
jgi:glycogen debranching enzyme